MSIPFVRDLDTQHVPSIAVCQPNGGRASSRPLLECRLGHTATKMTMASCAPAPPNVCVYVCMCVCLCVHACCTMGHGAWGYTIWAWSPRVGCGMCCIGHMPYDLSEMHT